MQWTVRLEARTSAGEVKTTELVTFGRPAVVSTLAEVGLVLAETKTLLAGLQASMLCGQVAYAAHHRLCPQCGVLQPDEDGSDLRIESRLTAAERSVERALADGQAEQLQQQPAQPLVADRVHEAQIHRQRHDADAEQRARLQSLRHRRKRRAATAPAAASVALHPRHHRRHPGQVDLVVAPVQHLVRLAERRLAVRASHRPGADKLIRGCGQRSPATHTAQAARARAVALALLWPVRLLTPRWRQAGVVRRLRRCPKPCFQLRSPCHQCLGLRGQHLNLRPQRPDQRVFLLVRQMAEIRELHHPSLESQPS